MATRQPSFELFLHSLSALIANAKDPGELARQIIGNLHDYLGPARASIQLEVSGRPGAKPLSIESPSEANSSFVFSRPIAVRGTEYGRLEVDLDTPKGSPQDWMYTLEILGQQLALYAERLRLEEEQERFASEVAELRSAVRTSKSLARASGILANLRSTTAESAEKWIVSEATRRGRETHVLAEQLILQHAVTRQIAATPGKRAVAA